MHKNIEHEVITDLAEKGVDLTIETSKHGFKINCFTGSENYETLAVHKFDGSTLRAALQKLTNSEAFIGIVSPDLFLQLNAVDEATDVREPDVDTFSILNPYLSELRIAFDNCRMQVSAGCLGCEGDIGQRFKEICESDSSVCFYR